MKICPKAEECCNSDACGHKEPHEVKPGCGINCHHLLGDKGDAHCCIEYEVNPMKICPKAEICDHSDCPHKEPHEIKGSCTPNFCHHRREYLVACIDYTEVNSEPLVVCPEVEICEVHICSHREPHRLYEECGEFCAHYKENHDGGCITSPNNLENEPKVMPSESAMLKRINYLLRNGFSQETAAAIAIRDKHQTKIPDQKPNSITSDSDQQLVRDCVKERLRSIDIE